MDIFHTEREKSFVFSSRSDGRIAKDIYLHILLINFIKVICKSLKYTDVARGRDTNQYVLDTAIISSQLEYIIVEQGTVIHFRLFEYFDFAIQFRLEKSISKVGTCNTACKLRNSLR